MSPPLHHDTARIGLARVTVSPARPLTAAPHDVAAVAADALAVGRVSIWRYLDDRPAIRCDFLYQPGYPGVSGGAIPQLRELPVYARMLGLRRVVTVNDVRGDPLGDEFRESYREPLGITGLAVVQQTIIVAGGFMEARSETGGGTTVGLGLPAIGAPSRLAQDAGA